MNEFQLFDQNGSGKISAKEFYEVLTGMGEPLSEEEAKDAVKSGDVDGDGFQNIDGWLLNESFEFNSSWQYNANGKMLSE